MKEVPSWILVLSFIMGGVLGSLTFRHCYAKFFEGDDNKYGGD